MAPIRLRHPKGVSTLDLDLDNQTVLDLQQEIYKTTEILPSQQESTQPPKVHRLNSLLTKRTSVKIGYPPQPLYIVPELPISSLGLKRGDQLIVTIGTGSSTKPSAVATSRKPTSSTPILPPQSGTTSKPTSTAPKSPESPRSPTQRHQASKPPPALAKANSSIPAPTDYVDTIGGSLVHRVRRLICIPEKGLIRLQVVPDDNSCLFSSVAVVFEQDIGAASRLRTGNWNNSLRVGITS